MLSNNQLKAEITELKKQKNAVILAHYYQIDEIQEVADFIGDSLELAKKAQNTDADVIAFCGVKFMAETAKILNPSKTVILPDLNAGCSLESSCRPAQFAAFRSKYPQAVAITYINCSAEIKALSDIICTSSNADKIIASVPKDKQIIFAPDKNLGAYLSRQTGREMILWDGACIVHETFSLKELINLKTRNQDALVIAHPECTQDLLDEADFTGSTSKLLSFVTQNLDCKKFIVLTEPGILYKMRLARPDAEFLTVPGLQKDSPDCINCNNCPFMKLNTLESLHSALLNLSPQIELSGQLIDKAKASLLNMLAIA
jgi:quinolinate synthase